jgi:hypothetical protein
LVFEEYSEEDVFLKTSKKDFKSYIRFIITNKGLVVAMVYSLLFKIKEIPYKDSR